jgi:hypothetical protein
MCDVSFAERAWIPRFDRSKRELELLFFFVRLDEGPKSSSLLRELDPRLCPSLCRETSESSESIDEAERE